MQWRFLFANSPPSIIINGVYSTSATGEDSAAAASGPKKHNSGRRAGSGALQAYPRGGVEIKRPQRKGLSRVGGNPKGGPARHIREYKQYVQRPTGRTPWTILAILHHRPLCTIGQGSLTANSERLSCILLSRMRI